MNSKIIDLTPQQHSHLQDLIFRYNQRTKNSKDLAQTYRQVLADRRSVVGFKSQVKEMVYPIVGERFEGAKFWDLDGHEYIDLALGFGTHLFGHRAPFIIQALEDAIAQGVQPGPQAQLAGNVAALACELTGMERICFCNSGTEAVMTSLRVARAATGRSKVVIFKGSYHGHFDGTLVRAASQHGYDNPQAIPQFPGVLQHMVDDVLVLDYCDRRSIEVIKSHADELAAVLTEPLQGCQPHLRPQEFLQELRQLTQESGIALIFDEILTGFRVHLGGVQALFGIEADIALYGKVLGGGMPIGAVAGKAVYLDLIDGGDWNYGDASYPQAKQTFYTGTFCKHPLAMATSYAVLKRLKQEGSGLQENLNQRSGELVDQLDAYFLAKKIPLKVAHFCSVFRLAVVKDSSVKVFLRGAFEPFELELLYYHLITKGVYLPEARIFFLSTVHTDEDIEYIIQAIKESVEELQTGGFIMGGR